MTDNLIPPVRGNIRFTSPFLARRRTYSHLGTDFGPQKPGVPGDPIVAAVGGTLVHPLDIPTYGHAAVIERGNGNGTYSYFHNAHLVLPNRHRIWNRADQSRLGMLSDRWEIQACRPKESLFRCMGISSRSMQMAGSISPVGGL
jgi:hypothetical protein